MLSKQHSKSVSVPSVSIIHGTTAFLERCFHLNKNKKSLAHTNRFWERELGRLNSTISNIHNHLNKEELSQNFPY